MNLPNIKIPDQFLNEHVELAIQALHKKAEERAKATGIELSYCAGCEFKDSFTGYIDPEGKLRLGMYFNMGNNTASVWGLLTPYTGEFETLNF